MPDRIRVAQHLLDRSGYEAEVVAQQAPLLRVPREREQTRGDRLAGRLVAGDHEDRERRVEITLGEGAAVEPAVRDQRQHVVAGSRAAVGVVLAPERAQLGRPGASEGQVAVLVPLALVGPLPDVLGLGVDEHLVGELDQARQVLVAQPEDSREHPNRDRRRDVVHRLELLTREGRVQNFDDERAQPRLVAAYRARREVGGEDAAELTVAGRVGLHEVPARGEHVLRKGVDRRDPAELRRERLPVAEHRHHVVVPRHHPEPLAARLRMAIDRRFAPKQLEDVPRLRCHETVVVEEVDVGEGRRRGGHLRSGQPYRGRGGNPPPPSYEPVMNLSARSSDAGHCGGPGRAGSSSSPVPWGAAGVRRSPSGSSAGVDRFRLGLVPGARSDRGCHERDVVVHPDPRVLQRALVTAPHNGESLRHRPRRRWRRWLIVSTQ